MAMSADEMGGGPAPSGLHVPDILVGEGGRAALGRTGEDVDGSQDQVNLAVTTVYSREKTNCRLSVDQTVLDLKKLLEVRCEGKPSQRDQMIIFAGKICNDGDTLRHVLRTADTSCTQAMHLMLKRRPESVSMAEPTTPPSSRPSVVRTSRPEVAPRAGGEGIQQSLGVRVNVEGNVAVASAGAATVQNYANDSAGGPTVGGAVSLVRSRITSSDDLVQVPVVDEHVEYMACSGEGDTTGSVVECCVLSRLQMEQLEWQYWQRFNNEQFTNWGHRLQTLTLQHALAQYQGFVDMYGAVSPPPPSYDDVLGMMRAHSMNNAARNGVNAGVGHILWQNVLTNTTASRFMVASQPGRETMPVPAGGSIVRDVTSGVTAGTELGGERADNGVGGIPRAGLDWMPGEGHEAWVGAGAGNGRAAAAVAAGGNGIDGRIDWEAIVRMIDLKLALKMVLLVMFLMDGNPIRMTGLVCGALVLYLYKTGIMEAALSPNGAGLWPVLGIIREDGGMLADGRYLMSAFVLSMFPP
ncbi:unnamed protein product [Choristocarpus tenellus]